MQRHVDIGAADIFCVVFCHLRLLLQLLLFLFRILFHLDARTSSLLIFWAKHRLLFLVLGPESEHLCVQVLADMRRSDCSPTDICVRVCLCVFVYVCVCVCVFS